MPEDVSRSVVVNIFDKNYTLAIGPNQTAAQVREVAQLVDESIRRAKHDHRPPSPVQAVVLAALNLVDELFQLQSDYRTAESDIAQRTSRLATSLGRVFEQVQVDTGSSSAG